MQRLTRDHVVPHGRRYQVFEPVLTVDPGATLVVETINHMTPIVRGPADLHPHGSPQYRERQETGPICVRGARPGDMLSIRVDAIEIVGLPHAHSCRSPLAEQYTFEPMVFPVVQDRCRLPGGISVPLRPMIGDIYTTPGMPKPPFYDHGGNMDFTEIGPGNTLYLPVFREGGLLVLGDVHAVQGDGELFSEGGETAADVTVTIGVDRRLRHPRPLVETADSWISLACRGEMFDSLRQATEDMVILLSRLHGLSLRDAYVLCALTGSVRTAGFPGTRESARNHYLVALSVTRDVRREPHAHLAAELPLEQV